VLWSGPTISGGLLAALLRRTFNLYILSWVISCMLHVPDVHNLKSVAAKHPVLVPSQFIPTAILYVRHHLRIPICK
jgi:hypothetical protein